MDQFSDYYSELLDGTYDCVDRIILNAYFPMGQAAGGFRTWWRNLPGSDVDLDNAHLMRLAGRLSRRVRAYAKAKGIPVIDCERGARKHEIAEQYIPKDPNFVGVFAILVGRAPAPVWEVQCSKNGKIVNISRKEPFPYVNHYSFHIIDPEWGHITIKLCGHPPFGAQIMLNGHEYVDRQARKQGISFTKQGNCFTHISDPALLKQIADTLSLTEEAIGRLIQVCQSWIYTSCLCFALDLAEQEKSCFRYQFTVFQVEYSRNLLFRLGSQMDQLFQSVIEHTRSRLDVKTLRTIFGQKKRPSRCKKNKHPRLEIVVERPTYDLTVFKVHFGKITAKMYSKGEHVLRIEIIVHNTKALRCRRSLGNFCQIVGQLQGILNRYLQVLQGINVSCIADSRLDELPTPSQVGQSRVAGVDINKPRTRAVVEAVIALSPTPRGFSSSHIAAKVRSKNMAGLKDYTARMATYDLKKLRGKNLVHLIDSSRRYESVPEGLQSIVALLLLREKVIKPVLAGAGKVRPGPKLKNSSPLDLHYEALQMEMRRPFQTIGLAA